MLNEKEDKRYEKDAEYEDERDSLPPHPYIPIIIVTSYFILQITYLLILILDFFSPSSNVYTLKYFFSKSGKSVGARLD